MILSFAFQKLIADLIEKGKMQALLLMCALSIASVRLSKGEEEEDRDELQQGFFEVDYMLQVQKRNNQIFCGSG